MKYDSNYGLSEVDAIQWLFLSRSESKSNTLIKAQLFVQYLILKHYIIVGL